MPSEYVVQNGDSLARIAKKRGLSSWRDIYFYPDNGPFRTKRPNPDQIFPGDRLILPDASEKVPLPSDADVPKQLRLPWRLAAELQISHLIPLSPATGSLGSPNSTAGSSTAPGGSSQLFAQIFDPSKSDPLTTAPVRPVLPMWRYGGSAPLLSAPCGPWGCARGPFDLDRPRAGSMGDVKDALLSTPQVTGLMRNAGRYLWSDAPFSRRLTLGIGAGLAIAGGVTALATSESLRNFALENLNDVEIPVGEAILMIPGLNRTWLPTVLRPVKFSLIWQEPGPVSGPPEPGTSSGLQGRGGMLILDLQTIVDAASK